MSAGLEAKVSALISEISVKIISEISVKMRPVTRSDIWTALLLPVDFPELTRKLMYYYVHVTAVHGKPNTFRASLGTPVWLVYRVCPYIISYTTKCSFGFTLSLLLVSCLLPTVKALQNS